MSAFVSCSSMDRSQSSAGVKITIESNMSAKIEVDLTKKLTGYASGGYLFHIFKVSGDNKYLDDVDFNGDKGGILSYFSRAATVRAAAAYNAIRTSSADVLVNAQYIIEENHWNPFFKQYKVKVVGNPGRIVSITNN